MSVAQVPVSKSIETARNPGRWMTLESVIVGRPTAVLAGSLMGLFSQDVARDLEAVSATIGLISTISTLAAGAGMFIPSLSLA